MWVLLLSEIADEIASIKASVTQLESAVEAAIASEDFDQADALQGDIDAKNVGTNPSCMFDTFLIPDCCRSSGSYHWRRTWKQLNSAPATV